MGIAETDAVGEVDAIIEERGRRPHLRHRGASSFYAENALTAAAGGFVVAGFATPVDERQQSYFPTAPNEQSPLLGDTSTSADAPSAVEDGAAGGERQRQGSQWEGLGDFDGLPWWKKPSIYWMLPAFTLFAFAFGSMLVPRLNLTKDLICRDYFASRVRLDPHFHYVPIDFDGGENEQCRIPEVQRRTTVFMLGDTVLAGLLTACTSPFLGALADRYGRNKLIAFTGIGAIIKEVVSIVAVFNYETFEVGWMYLGFVADGLCGSFIASLALAHAYASDCTPPTRRNVAFGFFHGCLFTGIALGPVFGGWIIEATGSFLYLFCIAFGLHLLFAFLLLFVIPESLSKRRQQEARKKHQLEKTRIQNMGLTWTQRIRQYNPFVHLKVLWPTGPGSSPTIRRNLILIVSIDTIMFGVVMGAVTVVLMYTNFMFGWSTFDQSVFISTVNIVRLLCLFIGLPALNYLIRGPTAIRQLAQQHGCDKLDLGIIRFSVVLHTLGFLGYTLVRTGALFTLSGCVTALGGIGSPTLQSAMTNHVPADRQGQLLGANAMLHAIARVVSPLIFSAIYYATVGRFTQLVFLCLTITFGVSAVLAIFLKAGVFLDETESTSAPDETEVAAGADRS